MSAMSTPEFSAQPVVWNQYFLSDMAWWNIYLTQSDAGNTQLRDLTRKPVRRYSFRFIAIRIVMATRPNRNGIWHR